MTQWQTTLPAYAADMAGQCLILEAAPGEARRERLQQWLQDVQPSEKATTWLLSCDFHEKGAWAGLEDFVLSLVPFLQEHAPDLIDRHSYALCLAAPTLQRSIQVKYLSLTDVAPDQERVRNYPLDRAYRSLHGLVELVEAWYELVSYQRLVLVCDAYDRSSPLVQRFFAELMRRRGERCQITLLLAVDPGHGSDYLSQFSFSPIAHTVRLSLPEGRTAAISKEAILQTVRELEVRVEQAPFIEISALSRLVHLWEEYGSRERALYWKIQAMHYFNHVGLYELSFTYCQEVTERLDEAYKQGQRQYYFAAYSTFFCYLSLGYAEQAYQIMQEKILPYPSDPLMLSQYHYFLAMLHSRFLPVHDYPKAEMHLQYALELVNEQNLPEERRYFHTVFVLNGLAYVRFRQGRAKEAIAICQDGLATLKQHLKPDQHQLHRSVLFYNIAQVYAATGPLDKALEAYTAAIEMDPHYSEYHNERGTVHFKMGHLEEAMHDYLRAIELSPPYAEVWTNLGQCYRAMERMEEALAAYSRALDLDPDVVLALAGRAEVLAFLQRLPEALLDYSRALTCGPQEPFTLAARATIYYELGQVQAALGDLDAAIQLLPDEAVFYQNRAAALLALDRPQEGARDLRTYLRLQPDADDREEIEQQLAGLQTIGTPPVK